MAALAGALELGGGLLTATGIAEPLGPMTLAGTMAVAATTHRQAGPFASKGGFELPLTNLAFAALEAATGPSAYGIGPRLSRRATAVTAVGVAGGAALAIGRLATGAGRAQSDAEVVEPKEVD